LTRGNSQRLRRLRRIGASPASWSNPSCRKRSNPASRPRRRSPRQRAFSPRRRAASRAWPRRRGRCNGRASAASGEGRCP